MEHLRIYSFGRVRARGRHGGQPYSRVRARGRHGGQPAMREHARACASMRWKRPKGVRVYEIVN